MLCRDWQTANDLAQRGAGFPAAAPPRSSLTFRGMQPTSKSIFGTKVEHTCLPPHTRHPPLSLPGGRSPSASRSRQSSPLPPPAPRRLVVAHPLTTKRSQQCSFVFKDLANRALPRNPLKLHDILLCMGSFLGFRRRAPVHGAVPPIPPPVAPDAAASGDPGPTVPCARENGSRISASGAVRDDGKDGAPAAPSMGSFRRNRPAPPPTPSFPRKRESISLRHLRGATCWCGRPPYGIDVPE
jgi:hypothetical protein